MAEIARPPPTPITNGNGAVTATLSAPTVPISTRPSGAPKAKGMQLGATKQPLSKAASSSIAAEIEREAAAELGGDAWAEDGDLMDVNADAGDWSEFSRSDFSSRPSDSHLSYIVLKQPTSRVGRHHWKLRMHGERV